MSTQETERPRARIAWWQWLIAVALFVGAGLNYYRNSSQVVPVVFGEPLRPTEVAGTFAAADRIAASPGALQGSNILLITLDTTRADRIGCYGNPRIQTPTLDRLATEGVIFSAAHATAPTTTPSHSSILTGLYPHHHGVRVNGFYQLAEEHTTLAEDLLAAGYQTGAVVSAFVLDERFGLNQGFESYNDDLSDADAPPQYRYKEVQADNTTDRALAWLDGCEADKPFFLWAHYFDPHAPYEAPEKFQTQSANVYDAEIAYTDAELARLLAGLEERGLRKNTLVVVLADHGESLYQHDEASHAMLVYDASTRIPFILSHPSGLPRNVHVSRRVSQVDLRPTLRSLLGLPAVATDGVDLTQAPDGARPIFLETLHPMLTFGWAPLFAVIEGDDKLIYGPGPELFDLATDFPELENRFDAEPELAARLTKVLRDEYGDLQEVSLGERNISMSAADLQKLQALGYVGSETVVDEQAERPNPRDMMRAFRRVEEIIYVPGNVTAPADRIAKLEALRKEYPDFVPLLRFLGDAYRESGDLANAEDVYNEAVRLQPNAPEPAFWLAVSQLQQNKVDEALATCEPILEKYPDYSNAAYIAGVLLLQKQDFDRAVTILWNLFERTPEFEQVASVIVEAHLAAGRLPELKSKLIDWLQREPDVVPVRTALANTHLREEDYAAANAVLREGVVVAPDDPLAAAALAYFLVATPDPEQRQYLEAITMMERANTTTGFSDPYLLYVLSVCYSQVGRIDEGMAISQKSIDSALATGNASVHAASTALLAEQKRAKEAGVRPVTPAIENFGLGSPAGEESE